MDSNKTDAIALSIFREIAAYLAEMPFSLYPTKSRYAKEVGRMMLRPTPNPKVGRVDLFHKILGDWYAAGRSYWVLEWADGRRWLKATDPLKFSRLSDGGYCESANGIHAYYPSRDVAEVPWCSICATPLRSLLHEAIATTLCESSGMARSLPPDPSCAAFASEMSAEIRRRAGVTRADAVAIAVELEGMAASRTLFASPPPEAAGGKLSENGTADPTVADRWLAENVAFVLSRAVAHAAPGLNHSILADKIRRKAGANAPKIAPYCFAVGSAIDRIIGSDIHHPLFDRAVVFEFGG